MRGGGVGLYVSKNLHAKVVSTLSEPNSCEALFLKIVSSGYELLVGVVYLPSGNLDALENYISEFIIRFPDVIILGDFNCDILDRRKYSCLKLMLTRCNLSVLHNNVPTHYDLTRNVLTMIDYTLVSNTSSITRSSQFHFPALNSRQAFILLDYDSISLDDLSLAALNTDFSAIYFTNDTDTQLSILSNILYALFNYYVPLRSRVIRNDKPIWYDNRDIRRAIINRDLSHRDFIENRSDESRSRFKMYRAIARRTIRRVKRSYGFRMFQNCRSYKELWSRVRSTGVLDSNFCDSDNCDIDLDNLNNYFTTPHYVPVNSLGNFTYEDDRNNCLSFRNIDMHILHLFNTIILTNKFPMAWKLARVAPMRKKGASALSKIFEIIIMDQLIEHLDRYSLIYDCQSGFRRHHSTTSLMIKLTDDIRRALDRGDPCILAALDLSKAFDSVDHIILHSKLYHEFKFSSKACRLLLSFLSGRSQYIRCDGRVSGVNAISAGVPQGTILGPVLFMLYVNDVRLCVQHVDMGIYTGDFQLLSTCTSGGLPRCISHLDDDIGRICDWAPRNHLDINIPKTKCIVFNYSRRQNTPQSITVQNHIVSSKDVITSLGYQIDSNLVFAQHIAHICSKLNLIQKKLYSINVILPTQIMYMLAHSLLMPHILYGAEVYTGTNRSNIRRLESSFHSILRRIRMEKSRNKKFLRFMCDECLNYIKNGDRALCEIKKSVEINKQHLKEYKEDFHQSLVQSGNEIKQLLDAIKRRYEERFMKMEETQQVCEKTISEISNLYGNIDRVDMCKEIDESNKRMCGEIKRIVIDINVKSKSYAETVAEKKSDARCQQKIPLIVKSKEKQNVKAQNPSRKGLNVAGEQLSSLALGRRPFECGIQHH
ncbi:uncharacterized protein LOC142224764 [Haematobia irritans]|uniref:uncharacterized protein LOC142224764 n=1 Tax=Haematobia irritans TaxID=7368 RepID=UPI003F4FEF9C